MTRGDVTSAIKLSLRDRLRALPAGGETRVRIRRLRSLLQEAGVRCDDTADLQKVDAFLLASERGVEAMFAAKLDDEQRLLAYARVVARLLADDLQPPLDFKAEYSDTGAAPSRREREDERMVMKLAHAIAEGELEKAPRPIFEDVPSFTLAFTPRSAARSTLGGFHWWSGYWYRRSTMYRWWRSRRDVSDAIERVCGILGRAAMPAA